MQMQMQPRDYVERPLNYLVATSSTWIHPHICVTGATKQLKDLLELEHLNFQRTATKGQQGTREVTVMPCYSVIAAEMRWFDPNKTHSGRARREKATNPLPPPLLGLAAVVS
jgi:hypothetical protein